MSRRKSKTEREIVADIKKLLQSYCKAYRGCRGCEFEYSEDCELEFAKKLFSKAKRELDEEEEE